MNSIRFYLLGLLVLFGGYVALEYYRPQPIDWTLTFSNKDKIPYGTYALFDVLPQLLGTDEVTNVRQPIYNQFFDEEEPDGEDTIPARDVITTTTVSTDSTTTTTTQLQTEPTADTTAVATEDSTPDSLARAQVIPAADSLENPDEAYENEDEDYFEQYRASYVFVNRDFATTSLEVNALRRFVAQGNDVFIAAWSFNGGQARKRGGLLDSLGVRERTPEGAFSGNANDSLDVTFSNPALAGSSLRLPPSFDQTYFEVEAGRQGQVLATDAKGRAMMVRLNYGRGHFLLCSVPLAFSNYYVLPVRTRRFALAALSYLPTGRPVWWDEYQKQGRVGEQSVLRMLLNHSSLRTAYYLLLATALLFIVFEARRRQRIIPVIKPLPNTTLLFTRTVASLYQQGSNHSRIAEKKVALFLDYLRNRFQEPTPDLADETFRERLSQKSGLPRPRIDELVRLINFARTAPTVTDQQLLILSRAIRDFKKEGR